MAEIGEGSSLNNSLSQRFREGMKRLFYGADYLFDALSPMPRVKAENINYQITAQRLFEHMGNPVRETLLGPGTYWDIPFSLREALAVLGHTPHLNSQSHFDMFPKECEATQKALQVLVDRGALEIVPLEEPDSYNQRIYWRVIDEAKLKEIARGKPTAKP